MMSQKMMVGTISATPGVGKTYLAIAFGVKAVEVGASVLFS